jgi:predicted RNase H-like HicB family nuclease
MDKKYYAFPAVFRYAEEGISIEFPDLPTCQTCAISDSEAFKNAKETLGVHLFNMEQDGDTIPDPSAVSVIQLNKDEVITMVEVFMPAIRDKMNNQFVKKTLSVPAWLNRRAEQEQVNFSHILQQGIKDYLNIQE